MINRLTLLVPKVTDLMLKHDRLLATAESCTGGGLSYWLTSINGSSTWFDRGFITYSNQAKIEMLGVKAATLNTYGAVSEETAMEMADGAISHSNANMSLAITGIAGPDGGSEQKPVGTVWIACARKDQTTLAQHFIFIGDRQQVRNQAMEQALTLLIAGI